MNVKRNSFSFFSAHEKYFGTTKTRKGTKYYTHVPSLPAAIYEKYQAVRDKVGTTKGTKVRSKSRTLNKTE